MISSTERYDRIGQEYARQRREDPAFKARIVEALGPAQSVLNVGAGSGNYEPEDRYVVAVEPSSVMAVQRPPDRPAVRAKAQALPFHDQSFDAAMGVLTLHHWHPDQQAGIRELCRISRDRIVLMTIDAAVSAKMWLMADYLHEVRDMDLEIFPAPEHIQEWLDRPSTVEVLPISRNTPDHALTAFWAHPEWVLDAASRAATSGFARQPEDVVQRVVSDVERDLDNGTWEARHGHLRKLDHYDGGIRLIRAQAR